MEKSNNVAELPTEAASSVTNVAAKLKDSDHSITIPYNFGANLEEAIELFGEDVVFQKYRQSAIVDLQAAIRRHLQPGEDGKVKSDDEIINALSEWKPGLTTRTRKSAKDKAMEALTKMSAEERQALMAELGLA